MEGKKQGNSEESRTWIDCYDSKYKGMPEVPVMIETFRALVHGKEGCEGEKNDGI